jgi:hypothetical protein
MKSGFEKFVANLLKRDGVSFKYESLSLPYTLERTYKPDFILDNGVIIETKGRFTSTDRTKMLRVKAAHPELDIRLWFQSDNWLTKKHTMRYSDWAIKNNFIYHVGKNLPDEWL